MWMPQSIELLRDAVLNAARISGATLIIVEHRLDAWAQHVDRVIVLSLVGESRMIWTPNSSIRTPRCATSWRLPGCGSRIPSTGSRCQPTSQVQRCLKRDSWSLHAVPPPRAPKQSTCA